MAIYGSGANLTNLPSSAPTTSQVATAMSGASVGSVGSYAFLARNNDSAGTFVRAGATESASNLEWGSTGGGRDTIGGATAGTWRCMGYANWGGGRGTLYIRIS